MLDRPPPRRARPFRPDSAAAPGADAVAHAPGTPNGPAAGRDGTVASPRVLSRRRAARVRPGDLAAASVLALACLALILTAPLHGEFLWSESPRNALNGAFIHDLVREMPLQDPVGWAAAYYLRYPSLTILFYPPLLHAALAAFYAAFGVSHAAAMACMGAFAYALATGVYALARRVASPPAALAGSLLLLASPELVVWGQQVMLEVPMMALAAWGAVFAARYGDRVGEGGANGGGAGWLAAAALFLVAAIYTKQTAAFIAAGSALALLVWRGRALLTRWHVYAVAAVAALALVPLALMQLRFGSFNVTSVVARADMGSPSRLSPAGLAWYAVRLPGMVGWPMLALAAGAVAGAALRPRWRLPRGDALMLAGWLLVLYAALGAIDLKETRHGLPLAVPLAVLAAASLERLVPPDLAGAAPRARWVAPALSAALLGVVLWRDSVVGATGYPRAAALVARLAPPQGRVLFSGNRDGAFVFNVRVQPGRGDIAVVRADKLFLDVAIMPQLGLNPREMDEAEIAALLNRIGIGHVVAAVPGAWTEAPVMAAFERVLASPRFEVVGRIPVTGPVGERELVVYRNTGPLSDPPEPYEVGLTAARLRFQQAPARP